MKNYCFIIFLVFWQDMLKIQCLNNYNIENQLQYNNLNDVIEYLARGSSPSEISLLEKQSRGIGCEAMNNCSDHGTCQNGTCVCDDGYDYYDCSVKIQSMNCLIFRNMHQ
jgi:hypothetical protein